LVDEGHVSGWDDPRMPTLAGMRRRGYTPAAIRKVADDSGASKSNIWLDYAVLDIALRADLDGQVARAMAVIDPIELHLTNWAEVYGSEAHLEACRAPAHPHRPELGERQFALGASLWIEREDVAELPPKGFFRLYPPRVDAAGASIAGSKVRLKYGLVVECTGIERGADGEISRVLAKVIPDTRSGTPGADAIKVKGVITWLSQADALPAELRLFDRLFTEAQPDAGGRDFLTVLNPQSRTVSQGFLEPSLAHTAAGAHFQFERHGYFVTDRLDHNTGRAVFNRVTGLKDSWSK
jgi:glutaminyl-tRNA synthetase